MIEEIIANSKSQHIVVTGPPGVGKTFLLKSLWIRNFRSRVYINLNPFVKAKYSANYLTNYKKFLQTDKICVILDEIDAYPHQLKYLLHELEYNLLELFSEAYIIWGTRSIDYIVIQNLPNFMDFNPVVINLAVLSSEDAENYIKDKLEDIGESLTNKEIQTIIKRAQGSPFFLDLVCREIRNYGRSVLKYESDLNFSDIYLDRLNKLFRMGVPVDLIQEITAKLSTKDKVVWGEFKSEKYKAQLILSGLFLIEQETDQSFIQYLHKSVKTFFEDIPVFFDLKLEDFKELRRRRKEELKKHRN